MRGDFLNALELAHTIVDALEDKKAENIILMDLQGVASFTDYFILCSGSSDRMLDALSKGALEAARTKHHRKGVAEGYAAAGWLVVDFGAVILHIFSPDQRQYYKLEELWGQGKILLRVQ